MKDKAAGFASMLTGGLIGGKKKTEGEEEEEEEEGDEDEEEGDGEVNREGDLEEGGKKQKKPKSRGRFLRSTTRRGSGKGRGNFSALEEGDEEDEEEEEDGDEEGGVQMQQYRSVSQRSNLAGPDVMNPMFQSASSGGAGAEGDANTAAVYDFYRLHNPTKMDSVPDILQKYKGREQELLEKLNKQYGVDNSAAVYEFYRKYNPTKVGSVPEILAKYKGKEQELLVKLHKQYNVPFGSAKF